jgi:hypothetical protein
MIDKLAGPNMFAAFFTFAMIACASFTAFGQAMAPAALVADLYKQHDAQKGPFFQYKDRAIVDKYFTRSTADLIWKDATTVKGEVGALGADPLYDAQDTEIKNFTIGKASLNGEKASVTVSFENFGEKKIITFALVTEGGKWKIDDISYNGGSYTLVGLFKEDAGSSEMAEFEGGFQVGPTTCIVKPVKMAFEVKWARGTGVEMFFAKGDVAGKYIFETEAGKNGTTSKFSFDDASYTTGTYIRKDGKTYAIKRLK